MPIPETAALFTLATWAAGPENWTLAHYGMGMIVFLLGFELLGFLVSNAPSWFGAAEDIPIRGKHLDKLEPLDVSFIVFNRLSGVVFVYHLFLYVNGPGARGFPTKVEWDMEKMDVYNTALALPALFVVYDLFYQAFHRALHHRSVYALVHKHHHRQKAPSRGSSDAVNVHPFEFLSGEYNHILAVAIVPCHITTVLVFIIIGGFLASLNHTRFDVQIPGAVYDVKWHDHHHVVPNSNYSQYTMLWDRIWGTFREHPDNMTTPAEKSVYGKKTKATKAL